MEHLIKFAASLFAALLVMILHEIPKTLVYRIQAKKKIALSKVFYFPQYIDPIGLIFCVFSLAGFSKPYRFEIKVKKNATYIGIVGLLSLLLCTVISYIIYCFCYSGLKMEQVLANTGVGDLFNYYFICYFLLISLGMFVVNLFPIAAFDMGFIIAGKSIRTFIHIIRSDTFIKLALFIVLFTEAIPMLGIRIINMLLSL